jgi:hypothetical protein
MLPIDLLIRRCSSPLAALPHTSHRACARCKECARAVWGIAPPQDRARPAGPVWAHVPHRVGRLLMPLPRRRMGLSSDEERALSEGAKAGAFLC